MSEKQPVVALSTTEAEYIALCSAVQEAVWLKRLPAELRPYDANKPITIHEDNQGTIAIAANPIAHVKTNQTDVKYHFVREARDIVQIVVHYCPSDIMTADILTKPLPKMRFQRLRSALGVVQ